MNLLTVIGIIYGFLFIVSFCISLFISFMECGKVSALSSLKEGAIWATPTAGLYAISMYFPSVRGPFERIIGNSTIGVGYLVMLVSWIMTMRMVHSTTSEVCQPDVNEMQEVRAKLMKELEAKQKEEEQNDNAKVR